MNQVDFEREALRIGGKLNIWAFKHEAVAFANAIRDLILKDLAENNTPVAEVKEMHGCIIGYLEIKFPIGTPLYAKPPIPPCRSQEAHEQAPEGWQPIETAPKDGTYILIMTVTGRNYVVAYDSTFSIPWRVMFDVGISEFVPTHWMPLPAAPEYKEDK